MEIALTTADDAASQLPAEPDIGTVVRFAVLSDIHLSPAGTPDGLWNNSTRRSVSPQLLGAALGEITQAGHHYALVLGDISDDGSPEMIGAALTAITDVGLEAWAVPGNHDVAHDAGALDVAAGNVSKCVVLHNQPLRLDDSIVLTGTGLRSGDGGQTCEAMNLADVAAIESQLLLWAGHYPLISQEAALAAAGLRYPGDLINLEETRNAAERHTEAIVVLHGHLHTVVTDHDQRMLQLGFPALVEWPHAWMDLSIEVSPGRTSVHTAIRFVTGNWSERGQNTLLASTEQTWHLDDGRWHETSTEASW